MSYVDAAAKQLGPFEVENKDSKHPGCREHGPPRRRS